MLYISITQKRFLMMNNRVNWFKSPSIKQLVIFIMLWLTGNLLLVLSITDLFTASFIQKSSLMLYFLMAASTVSIVKLYMNYRNQP